MPSKILGLKLKLNKNITIEFSIRIRLNRVMAGRKKIEHIATKYLDSLSSKTIYLDADQFGDLVDYFYEKGEIDTAYNCIDDGLSIHPDNEQLKIKKIKLLSAEGNYEEATYLMMGVSLEYDFELYFAKLQCILNTDSEEDTESIQKKILEEEKDQLDSILIDIAFLYIESNNYQEAIKLFKRVKNWDKYMDDLSDFAFCYEVEGEYDKAIELYESLLNKNSYSENYWYNLGRLYALKEEYAKAVDAMDFALLNGKDLGSLNLKANCLILLDRVSEAVEIYEELIQLEPDNIDLYLKLFDSYTLSDRPNDAKNFLELYKDKQGEDEEYLIRKINNLLLLNDIASAKEEIEKALLENKQSIKLTILIVDLLISQGLLEEALEHLSHLNNTDIQDDEELLNRMSYLCVRLNIRDKALEYTTQLLIAEPHNKKYKQRLAYYLMEEYDFAMLQTYISNYSNEELLEIVSPYFQISSINQNDREALIIAIKNIIENRNLYKSIKF